MSATVVVLATHDDSTSSRLDVYVQWLDVTGKGEGREL